jgi:hypothetical protein
MVVETEMARCGAKRTHTASDRHEKGLVETEGVEHAERRTQR